MQQRNSPGVELRLLPTELGHLPDVLRLALAKDHPPNHDALGEQVVEVGRRTVLVCSHGLLFRGWRLVLHLDRRHVQFRNAQRFGRSVQFGQVVGSERVKRLQ